MRLIDADKLNDTIIRLNEEDWQITRYEYKRIDGVVFEMPTVKAVPIEVLQEIRQELIDEYLSEEILIPIRVLFESIDKHIKEIKG